MKPQKPHIIDRLKSKQDAKPSLQPDDLQNLIFAARRGLAQLGGQDLVLCSMAIANGEAVLAAILPPAPAAPADAKAQPTAPEKPKA